MLRLVISICVVILINIFGCVYNETISIPLFRQKSPRESAMNTPNIAQHGIWLDWLKPKGDNRTNDTIPLLRFLDSEFYGEINVGKPGQKLRVVFDTAWSSSWIISKDCPSRDVGCWFHNKYNHGVSSTYKRNGEKFIADEGTYNLTGYYSNDTISIAHSRVNQTFIEMTNVPYWYIFSKSDGVIGLGLKYDAKNPFFYNLISQTNITKPIFCIYLNRDKSSNKGGSITLGVLETKHIHQTNGIAENITYVPVNVETGLWEFNIDRIILINGKKVTPICVSNCKGLADSSSNSIITSKKALDQLNELIGAKPLAFGKYEVNCDTVDKLPFIDFVIGGTNFNLTGRDYTQKISVGPVTLCISAFTASSTSSESNRWIMGGAFLAKFYSIYDLEKKRMGFVRAATA